MDTFLQLPAVERRLAFQQVEATMGLQALSVEKDFWVCWTLRELHRMPNVGGNLTFKGGTSLSKVWKVIQRFSEDIDFPAGCRRLCAPRSEDGVWRPLGRLAA